MCLPSLSPHFAQQLLAPLKSNLLRVHFRRRCGATSQSSVDAAPIGAGTSPAVLAGPLPIATPALAASTSNPWAAFPPPHRTKLAVRRLARVWDSRHTEWYGKPRTTLPTRAAPPSLPGAHFRRDNRHGLPRECLRQSFPGSPIRRCETAHAPRSRYPVVHRRTPWRRPRSLRCNPRAPPLSEAITAFQTHSFVRCTDEPYGGIAARRYAKEGRRREVERRSKGRAEYVRDA